MFIRFDEIAKLMGVPSSSFVDTYRKEVHNLMVKLVEYIQTLDNIINPTQPEIGTGGGAGPGPIIPIPTHSSRIQLQKTTHGYPILPDPIPSEGWKKSSWDSLFSDYLGQQYHLAFGGKICHIPYKLISEKQKDFIDSVYLPRKTIFRPPRNIGVDEMKSIFDHLLQRQRNHGPEDTFKFKSIKLKGKSVPSQYKTVESNEIDCSSSAPPGATAPGATTPGPTPIRSSMRNVTPGTTHDTTPRTTSRTTPGTPLGTTPGPTPAPGTTAPGVTVPGASNPGPPPIRSSMRNVTPSTTPETTPRTTSGTTPGTTPGPTPGPTPSPGATPGATASPIRRSTRNHQVPRPVPRPRPLNRNNRK